MDPDPLARLRSLVGSIPPGWAMWGDYVWEPSSHAYDWAAIERDIGVPGLPADYKQLMDGYGPLVIAGIFIVNPGEFRSEHELLANSLREWWAEDPEGSLPVHPEPGGLLLCASTEGRDVLWWDTSGPDPDRWTITWDVEFERHTFDGTLTDLLVAELTGQLEPPLTAFADSTQ